MAAPLRKTQVAEKSRVKILLVDDQPGKLLTYEAVLDELDEVLVKASSAQEAFAHLLNNDFAVILIDVCMPELDGYQLAAMIREHPRFEKTPLIFISAVYISEIDRLRGYESGAVDYVPVPVVPEILRAKVKVFVELHRKTRELEKLNQELEDRVTSRTAELERSNAALTESEERLRLASEAAEFGTYECNPREERIYCSPQMRRLMECPDDELDFDSFLEYIHPGDRSAVRRHILAFPTEETRKRFEFRLLRTDGSVCWLLDCGRALFHDNGEEEEPSRVIGTILDVTERKRVEERQLLLMAELDHRVKNILANVSAIAKLSSKRGGTVEDFVKALDARIQAISRAHSLLRRDSWVGINMHDFAQELLVPFISRQGHNVLMEGDAINLRPKAAQSLALALHELATNAVKYGALSVPEGRVRIAWKGMAQDGAEMVKLTWTETGGPPVKEPAGSGFGLTAIRAVATELGATLRYDFHPEGVACELEGSLGQPTKAAAAQPPRTAASGAAADGGEAGAGKLRILIVEDEAVVALQVKHDLEAAGHKVVAMATNLAQGLQLADSSEIDVAFLDVRLGDDFSTAVAENLIKRGIPFAFGTGFEDDSILPSHLRSIPRLVKPYETDGVSRLLTSLSRAH